MDLYSNKTLEDDYHIWLANQKEEAKFFAEAWAHRAMEEQPTPNKSRKFLHELQPELPSSYVVRLDESIDNLSRVIFQEAIEQLNDKAGNNPWRNKMKVINNNRKINLKVGDVIKYWNKTSPYPRYAMIIESYEQGYSAVILSDKACPDNVGHVSLNGAACQFGFATPKFLWSEPKRGWVETESIQRYTLDSPYTVFQQFFQKWDYVEKVPFFGVEGCSKEYEAGDEPSKSKELAK